MNYIPENAQKADDIYSVEITPELAKKWLRRNYFNRHLRKDVVREYARCMKKGLWGESESCLTISQNGMLLNGQHRLAAVVMSGVTIKSWVQFNAKIQDHLIYDHAHKRTLLEVFRLELQDDTIRDKEIQVLKAMLAGHRCDSLDDWSAAELIPYFRTYGPRIGEIIDRFGEKFDTTALAVIVKASFYVSERKIREFFYLRCREDEKHPSNGIVRAYLNWLSLQSNRRAATRREIYKWTQFVINAVLGKKTTCEIPSVTIDLFPLKEDAVIA